MKQYIDVLNNILANGTTKPSARPGMPATIGLSFSTISHDMSKGFPLLTTKEVYYKGVLVELIWFLKGDTNIKYLVDNDCNIWNKDAYRWYSNICKKQQLEPIPMDMFIKRVKEETVCHSINGYKYGDLGKVYGHQWRNQNGVDQVANVIKSIKEDPYSRYHIIDAWNAADKSEMALPPCHLLYQFICRSEHGMMYLDLNMYQRSCDTFLGVPFNIASMGFLLEIIAKVTKLSLGVINWIGGDTHLYTTHIEQAKEQIERHPMKLPIMCIDKDLNSIEDIEQLKHDDFIIIGYNHHPKIKAELSVGE